MKEKDKIYVEESYWSKFNLEDLRTHSGIKIKNSINECFLKRTDDDQNLYWAKCMKINNKIKEVEVLSEEELLKILNEDMKNYILVNP